MAELGWASIAVAPTFSGFGDALEKGTSKHMVAAGASGGASFGDAAGKTAGKRFGSAMKSAAKVAALGLAAAGATAIKLGKDSIAEAREAQKVGALTESTIKATGKAARVTAKHVGDLAGAISAKSGIDDEVIQSGANMILTFKNIRNEAGKNEKIFDRSTQATADMAAAMAGGSGGVDLKSSAILVGKALNDPAKGLSALTRVGITFSEQQKDQIKSLTENGETMKAQKLILRELESQFGGAAEAQATMGEKTSVAWGNIKEGIGTTLLPLVDDVQKAFLEKGVPAAEKFTTWFTDKGIPAIGDFADEAKPLVNELLPAMGDTLGIARDALKEAAPYAKDMVDAFNDMPDWAKTALVGGGAGLFAGRKLGLLGGGKAGGGGGVAGLISKAKPVPVFVTNPGGIGGAGGAGSKGLASKIPPWLAILGGGAAMTGGAWFDRPISLQDKADAKGATVVPGLDPSDLTQRSDGSYSIERKLGIVNDAWAKVRGSTDKARESTLLYDASIDGLPDHHSVLFNNPSLGPAITDMLKYKSLLDGLDGRTVTTFLRSINANNAIGGEGSTAGQPPGRSGRNPLDDANAGWRAGVVVNINKVEAKDYGDLMRELQHRSRRAASDGLRSAALGGADFRE